MAILITIFLLVKVVPVFGDIFSSFNAKLPGPTLFMINLSEFVKKYILLLLLGVTTTAVVQLQRIRNRSKLIYVGLIAGAVKE